MNTLVRLPAQLALGLISAYRYLISPLLGPNCRFHPSCSHYAAEAIEKFGLLSGLWLGARRLARCHPWNAGGVDPVPETIGWRRPAAKSGSN